MPNAAIAVSGLSKLYHLGATRVRGYRTLTETISESARSVAHRIRRAIRPAPNLANVDGARASKDLWALRDVSFSVSPGEMVGIIGRNGAGKSTLLKILSRITEPTAGRIALRGQLGSLLEVGTGFHPELTGRENIFLNGAILGMTRREIARKLDAIIEFAEMAQFIDTPVKRYSSGMQVRLAFAVSAHLEPNILLLDEVLSVGDLAFQRKCMDHAQRLRKRNATVLFVSHNMFTIKAMCDRAIYLNSGRMEFDGAVEEGIARYENDCRLGIASWAQPQIGSDPAARPIRVTDIQTLSESGQPRTVFDFGERMRVRLAFHAPNRLTRPNFVVCLLRSDGVACCNYSTAADRFPIESVHDSGTLDVLSPTIKLVSETYSIQVLVWDEHFTTLHCAQTGPGFHVRHPVFSTHFGVYHESGEWELT